MDAFCLADVRGIPGQLSLCYRIDPEAEKTGSITLITQVRNEQGVIEAGWLRRTVSQCIVFVLPVSKHIMFVDTMWLRDVVFSGLVKDKATDTGWIEKGGTAGRGVYFPAEILLDSKTMLSNIYGLKR